MIQPTRLFCTIAASVLACVAQDYQLSGPVSGWVYDPPSRSVRLILGMPGAARFGPAVVQGISWASVAPDGHAAIVETDHELRILGPSDAARNTTGTPVGGAVANPRLAAWAADSSAVALYSAGEASVQWIRIEGETATADAVIPLAGIDGAATCMAADSTSGRVFLGVSGKGLYRVSASDGPILLADLTDISAVAVDPGGRRAWIADRANAQIVEVSQHGLSPVLRTFLADPERLQDVAAIAISQDRRTLYVADRRTNRLYSVDRASASLASEVELPAAPTALIPVGRPAVFVTGYRSQASDALYLLIMNADPPSLFFVPGGDAQ